MASSLILSNRALTWLLAVGFGLSSCGGKTSGPSPANSCNDNGVIHSNGASWTCSYSCDTCSCKAGRIDRALSACIPAGPEGGASSDAESDSNISPEAVAGDDASASEVEASTFDSPVLESGTEAGTPDAGRCLTASCNGACVDEQTDPDNCGTCGMMCPAGEICQSGTCGNPPSCAPGGLGMTNCGDGTQSCCASLEVPGGTYYRTYDEVFDAGRTDYSTAADGGPVDEADLATISGFRLDKYEVTVGRFRQFVGAWSAGWLPAAGSGKHAYLSGGQGLVNIGNDAAATYEPGWLVEDNSSIAPTDNNLTCDSSATWPSPDGINENLPINCVTWFEAYAFCIWDGGFLPSEAEWESAAAGGNQQREYPWGTASPGTVEQAAIEYAIYDCYYPPGSVICNGVANIAPVGAASMGAGLWGQLDLAGNVYEWNLDWYAAYADPCTDCVSVTVASDRVFRGGGFSDDASYLFPSHRIGDSPGNRFDFVGLRCARPP